MIEGGQVDRHIGVFDLLLLRLCFLHLFELIEGQHLGGGKSPVVDAQIIDGTVGVVVKICQFGVGFLLRTKVLGNIPGIQ